MRLPEKSIPYSEAAHDVRALVWHWFVERGWNIDRITSRLRKDGQARLRRVKVEDLLREEWKRRGGPVE